MSDHPELAKAYCVDEAWIEQAKHRALMQDGAEAKRDIRQQKTTLQKPPRNTHPASPDVRLPDYLQ